MKTGTHRQFKLVAAALLVTLAAGAAFLLSRQSGRPASTEPRSAPSVSTNATAVAPSGDPALATEPASSAAPSSTTTPTLTPPVTVESVPFRPTTTPLDPYEEAYTRQTGILSVDAGVLRSIDTRTAPARLVLTLFPDATYTTEVESAQQDINGVRSISGRIVGHALSTFTLSEKNGIVLADLTDMANGRVFKIKYSAPRHEHIVIEYNPASMPPRFDGYAQEPAP